MKYIKMYPEDMVNGSGIRLTIFLSGCDHGCKGCYNTDTWSCDNGTLVDKGVYDVIYTEMAKPYVKGLSLSGGDPMNKANLEGVLEMCRFMALEFPEKDIWLWTGYTLDQIENGIGKEFDLRQKILMHVDVLVDGLFVQEKHVPNLRFRGSTNQVIWERDDEGLFVKSEMNND